MAYTSIIPVHRQQSVEEMTSIARAVWKEVKENW